MRFYFAGSGFAVIAAALTISVMANDRSGGTKAPTPQSAVLSYEEDGRMQFPSQYREWVYLSSGFNMSYSDKAPSSADASLFDNVFADPGAYRAFQRTGEWPDGTVLVLEVRNAQNRGSINKSGHFQSSMNHFEAHVKDSTRFPNKWGFFGFEGEKSGRLIPQSASCYSCHAEHAAVDTTFVQFYPTLLPIAEQRGKLSSNYSKELSGAANVSK